MPESNRANRILPRKGFKQLQTSVDLQTMQDNLTVADIQELFDLVASQYNVKVDPDSIRIKGGDILVDSFKIYDPSILGICSLIIKTLVLDARISCYPDEARPYYSAELFLDYSHHNGGYNGHSIEHDRYIRYYGSKQWIRRN